MVLFLIAITSSIYFLSFDFVGVDDVTHILKNPHLRTFDGLLEFWKTPYFGLYIPFTYSIWWAIYQICGASSVVFHGLSILTHAFNGVLVFYFLNLLFKNEKLSFFSALLFLIHPMQAGSVAWVSEFRGLIGTYFALLALLGVIQYVNTTRVRYLVLSLLFFACGVLSKPSFISLIFISPALFYFYTRRIRDYKFMALAVIQMVISLVIILKTQTLQNTYELAQSPMVVVNNLGFYTLRALWPALGQFDYGYTLDHMKEWRIGFLIAFIFLIFLTIRPLNKDRTTFWFLMFFILALVPTLGFVPFSFQYFNTVADRYLYFALLFSSFLWVFYLNKILKKYDFVAIYALALICVGLYITTALQYRNSKTFAEFMLQAFPESFIGRTILGEAQIKSRDYALAEKNLREAINLKPQYWVAHSQLGELFEVQKRWDDSLKHFQSIIKNEHGRYQTITSENLGEFYLRSGLARLNLNQKSEGLKDIELGRTLAPLRYEEFLNNPKSP